MKYIRTKDGKIYEIVESNTWTTNQISKDIVEKALNDNKYFKDDIQVIAQADTIEELCDEFIEVWQSGDLECHSKINIYNKRAMNEYNRYRKETSVIYGEIWVDGELHKVAKMTEKGLELL